MEKIVTNLKVQQLWQQFQLPLEKWKLILLQASIRFLHNHLQPYVAYEA